MSDQTTPDTTSVEAPSSAEPSLSRRQALAVGSGLAAAAAAGSVAAAGPAAAQTATGEPQTLLSVSLRQAKAVVAAAEREASRLGVAAHVVVVDVCGDVKASSRQDGNSPASLTLAPLKAHTALAFRTGTTALLERTTSPVRQQSFLAAGFTLLGGGLPLTWRDRTIGAIGVGGGSPEQDDRIGEAGRRALRR